MANSTSAFEATRFPVARALAKSLARHWWVVLLRGVIGILFGVAAIAWPLATLLSLVLIWGIYAIADGVLALWAAISGQTASASQRWWLALVGVAGIVAGAAAFLWPGLTAGLFVLLIASWAIAVGVLQIIGAIALRKQIEGEWMMVLSGLLSVAFGVALIAWPAAGALTLVWIIGWAAILIGACYVGLAFRLNKLNKAD